MLRLSKFKIGAMIDQSQELHVQGSALGDIALGADSVLSAQDQAAHAGAIYYDKANAHHVKAQGPEDNRLRAPFASLLKTLCAETARFCHLCWYKAPFCWPVVSRSL